MEPVYFMQGHTSSSEDRRVATYEHFAQGESAEHVPPSLFAVLSCVCPQIICLLNKYPSPSIGVWLLMRISSEEWHRALALSFILSTPDKLATTFHSSGTCYHSIRRDWRAAGGYLVKECSGKKWLYFVFMSIESVSLQPRKTRKQSYRVFIPLSSWG